jgi:hypothetical protein
MAVRSKFKMGSRTIRKRERPVCFFPAMLICPNELSWWTGAAASPLTFYLWLAAQKVSFIRINWRGDIVCFAGASGYSANPFRVRWQLETRENPEERNDIAGR